MKISYQWLRELVPLTLAPGELADKLTMAGFPVDGIELAGDDHIIEFDLTSNRPDALCHYGIAREAALICGVSVKPFEANVTESTDRAEEAASIEIYDADLCPRYAGRVVRGVKVGPSPTWLIRRLESIGQRTVNNIADITNYVMFEMGQPTHAFDLNLLLDRRIIVRRARDDEMLRTLDGLERKLSSEMLVIADADRPVALAGIMGGDETEISSTTTDVLIESAYFHPSSIRHTARALGMDTEASYRFSRGADFEAQVRAADRVAQLIAEVTGGTVLAGVLDIYPARIARDPVRLREWRIEHLTGLRVEIDKAAELLRGLGFAVELLASRDELLAIPPSFRIDVSQEEDLVEEVARHVGYDLVDSTLPVWGGMGRYLEGDDRRRAVRRALANTGFDEAISFSFVNGERDELFRHADAGAVALTNPIDASEDVMRTSLLGGLLEAVQRNLNHGTRDIKLFELGRIFRAPNEGERPDEREVLGLVMSGGAAPEDWRGGARQVDFYDLKGMVELITGSMNISGFTIDRASVEYLHPGQSAALVRDGHTLGLFGRLHPKVASLYKFRQPVYVGEIEFGRLLELPADDVRYNTLSRYPAVSRDVSVLLPESVPWAEIERAVYDLGIEEVISVRLFDMYRGKGMPPGMRSIAFRVMYRSRGRTLTDDEVTRKHELVREMLASRFGAELR